METQEKILKAYVDYCERELKELKWCEDRKNFWCETKVDVNIYVNATLQRMIGVSDFIQIVYDIPFTKIDYIYSAIFKPRVEEIRKRLLDSFENL